MEFRKAVEADANRIMNIIKQAQGYFKDQGIDQWQNNYPNFETIQNDISSGNGYVLLKDENVVGTVVLSFDEDKNYATIYNGEWISKEKYVCYSGF